MKYIVTKQVELVLNVEVEADSPEEAQDMVDKAWSENEIFVKNVLVAGHIYDSSIYVPANQDSNDFESDFDTCYDFAETCEQDLLP